MSLRTLRMKFWQPCRVVLVRAAKSESIQLFLFSTLKSFLKMLFCTCRMKIWRGCQKTVSLSLKIFRLKSGSNNKFLLFIKINYVILEKFLWTTRRMQIRQCWSKKCLKSEMILRKIRKWSWFFLKKKVFSKIFFGHIECSFHNPAESLCWNFPIHFDQKTQLSFFSWPYRMEVSANCSTRQVGCKFDITAENLLAVLWRFSLTSGSKFKFFSDLIVFLTPLLRTVGMEVWQRFRKTFASCLKSFSWNLKVIIFFLQGQ